MSISPRPRSSPPFAPIPASRRQSRRLACAVSLALTTALSAACIAHAPSGGGGTAGTLRRMPDPLARAHAHNDYVHGRPLLDALELGFRSVEADVHLVGGELLVAHHRDSVEAVRTLERLYLAPMRAHLARPDARARADGDPLLLLIDVKSEAEATYAAVDAALQRYGDIVTAFIGDSVAARPVVAVLTGNRALATVGADRVRYVVLDGRLPDLYATDGGPSPLLMPLVSDAWDRITRWRGEGAPPPMVSDSVARVVARAHAAGRRVRFWGTPDRESVWQLLHTAGVDLIHGDDLVALRAFLSRR